MRDVGCEMRACPPKLWRRGDAGYGLQDKRVGVQDVSTAPLFTTILTFDF